MPIVPVVPVHAQPEVTLINWCIVESSTGERHFAGYCIEQRSGRFSTAILAYDPSTHMGLTCSGRIYLLQGSPGFDIDAQYLLYRIAAARDINFIDVSEDMLSVPYSYDRNKLGKPAVGTIAIRSLLPPEDK